MDASADVTEGALTVVANTLGGAVGATHGVGEADVAGATVVGEMETVGDTDAVGETVGETEGVADTGGEPEAVGVDVVGVIVGEGHWVGDTDGVGDTLGEIEGDADVIGTVDEGTAEGKIDWLCDTIGKLGTVTEGDDVAGGTPLVGGDGVNPTGGEETAAETTAGGDSDAVAEGAGESDALVVELAVSVPVGLGLPEGFGAVSTAMAEMLMSAAAAVSPTRSNSPPGARPTSSVTSSCCTYKMPLVPVEVVASVLQ